MKNQLQTKHGEKLNLKKDVKATSYQLQRLLLTFVYITLMHQINFAIHSRVKSIVKRHVFNLKFRQ